MKARTKYICRKWRLPNFHDWHRKAWFLYREQNEICAISKREIVSPMPMWTEIHHVLARKKENFSRFPNYVDCVWNLLLVLKSAHPGVKPETKKRPLHVIDRLERILAENPGIEYEMTAEEALEEYTKQTSPVHGRGKEGKDEG